MGRNRREINNGISRLNAGEFAELSSSYICIELYFIFPCLLVKIHFVETVNKVVPDLLKTDTEMPFKGQTKCLMVRYFEPLEELMDLIPG